MEILVKRTFKGENYTIGKLYIDNVYICDTLEDKVRDINNDGDLTDVGEFKVYGKTAIPKGIYKCTVYRWNKINRNVLLLHNVPMFEGILIHGGVDESHSLGCILVGFNKVKGKLLNSREALDSLMGIVESKLKKNKKEEIKLTII